MTWTQRILHSVRHGSSALSRAVLCPHRSLPPWAKMGWSESWNGFSNLASFGHLSDAPETSRFCVIEHANHTQICSKILPHLTAKRRSAGGDRAAGFIGGASRCCSGGTKPTPGGVSPVVRPSPLAFGRRRRMMGDSLCNLSTSVAMCHFRIRTYARRWHGGGTR